MHYYQLYSSTVKSELEFPALLPIEPSEACDISIVYAPALSAIQESIAQGNRMGMGPNISWLHTEYGTFTITNGSLISIDRSDNAADWELRPFVIGYAIATLFMQRNQLAFHCSAISLDNQAYIFSGYSGSGKSTTTNTFLQHGAFMLADDMIVVSHDADGYHAHPAYPQQKLCKDAVLRADMEPSTLRVVDEEREKYAIKCHDIFCNRQQPIKAYFILQPCETKEVTVTPIPKEKVPEQLFPHLFLHISLEISGTPPAYMFELLQFIQQVPVYLVKRPSSGRDTTEDIFQKITEIIA